MAGTYRTLSFLPLARRGRPRDHPPMTTATNVSILVFDGLTALDAIGPYEVLRSVPGWEVSFVGRRRGAVRTDSGSLGLAADHAFADRPAADILLIPGGEGNRPLLDDDEVLDWVREVDRGSRWTTSVCTGSLVLGAAGLLEGRRATGHWLYLEPLREYGAEPQVGRWVEDGKLLTAAGVSAGIDMALHLVGREAGTEVAQAIQLMIEYDPQPPFDAGSPAKAPAPIVELVTAVAEAPGSSLNLDSPPRSPASRVPDRRSRRSRRGGPCARRSGRSRGRSGGRRLRRGARRRRSGRPWAPGGGGRPRPARAEPAWRGVRPRGRY